MCRKLRQIFELPDSRFPHARDALAKVDAGEVVVLVDDFIGSGAQFEATWNRPRRSTVPRTFSEAAARHPRAFALIAVAATDRGIARIRSLPSPPPLYLAHVLTERDSYRSSSREIQSHPLGEALPAELEALVRRFAPRLQLKDYMKQNDFSAFGFDELGLSLAFHHSVPDS